MRSQAERDILSLLVFGSVGGVEEGRGTVEPGLKRGGQYHGLGRGAFEPVPRQLGRQYLLAGHPRFQLPDLPLGIFSR